MARGELSEANDRWRSPRPFSPRAALQRCLAHVPAYSSERLGRAQAGIVVAFDHVELEDSGQAIVKPLCFARGKLGIVHDREEALDARERLETTQVRQYVVALQ